MISYRDVEDEREMQLRIAAMFRKPGEKYCDKPVAAWIADGKVIAFIPVTLVAR